jgi:hypothetical protein
MPLPNIFTKEVANNIVQRINSLNSTSVPLWGKMNVAQMLAHCNITYEMVFDDKHQKPNALLRFFLKMFVKKMVVNDADYKKNNQTAPAFIIRDSRDFEQERHRLIDFIQKTQELGVSYFHNKDSHSFGKLTSDEWNNMFYKHLNHHLSQFGV